MPLNLHRAHPHRAHPGLPLPSVPHPRKVRARRQDRPPPPRPRPRRPSQLHQTRRDQPRRGQPAQRNSPLTAGRRSAAAVWGPSALAISMTRPAAQPRVVSSQGSVSPSARPVWPHRHRRHPRPAPAHRPKSCPAPRPKAPVPAHHPPARRRRLAATVWPASATKVCGAPSGTTAPPEAIRGASCTSSDCKIDC